MIVIPLNSFDIIKFLCILLYYPSVNTIAVLPVVFVIGAVGTMGTGENYMVFVTDPGNATLHIKPTYG